MKPKLKNDTLYIPSADGIYFVSNHGTLTLKGKQVYQWVDRLAPHLNGTRTLEEITSGLSEDRKSMVVNLVQTLFDKGFVKDVTDDRPHTLTAQEERAYESEIAFIDYYTDSAAHRFQRFRESRILAIGSGLTLTALVHANLHSGLQRVDVMTTHECPTNSARHEEYLELARERDPEQTLVERAAGDSLVDDEAARAAVEPFDAVIHVSDRPMLGRARVLSRACAAARKVFIQAVVLGDRAWIGPLVGPGDGACWECAWLRLMGHNEDLLTGGGFIDRPDATTSEFLAGPTAAIVSNQLSFEIFKYITGAGPLETEGKIVGLDLETLQSESHPVFPHPRCTSHRSIDPPGEAELLSRVRRLTEGDQIDWQAFSQRAARCFDERTGLLGSLDELDFMQLPLKVSRATVSNPNPIERAGSGLHAIGVGPDFTTARQRATRRACELFAASVVDRRPASEPGQADVASDDAIWSYDLSEGRARKVAAGAGFPILGDASRPDQTAPGLASGFSWPEAVSNGLLGWCHRLTVEEMGEAAEPFSAVDLKSAPLTEHARRCLRILETVGERVTIYDVTGSLAVPTFAACLENETVACASKFTVSEALEAVLERTVQYYQARANAQPAYAPPDPPHLPPNLRGPVAAALSDDAPSAWQDRQEWLQRRLEARGWRPVVIPLDHDPVMREVLPYIVNVVLTGRD